MATLRVYRGDQFVAPFELGEGRTRIGRGTENQLVLEDKDKQVSRSHAEIWFERGHYVIADLNSQNGVWIGERQIKTEEVLPVNIPITIGPYRLILEASQPTVLADMVDGAEMTRESGAFVEPTQLADAVPIPPPPPAARSHATKIPAAKVPAAKVRPGASGKMIGIAALIAVIAIGAVVVGIIKMRNGSTPDSTTAEVQPQTTITTTSVPQAPPTPEERFLDHYNKAVALIAANDKPGALAENKEALAALPDDPRGLEQQKTIGAMPEPGQTAGPPPPGGPLPPGTPQKPPAAPVPEFLVVQARPGESEKDRLTRERGARSQLEDGKKAFAEQRWDSAIAALVAALKISERNDYGTVANEANQLLRQAQKSKATADATVRRANAQRVMDEAHTIGASNVLLAVQKVREAQALDPQVDNATELLNTLIEHGRVQGENAVRLGRNAEVAGKKDEAIRDYERGEKLLELGPPDNKSLEFVRQRLAQLKPTK